ncbi:FHA domain-containing protein [Streptomyces sp. KMM 9044]|uniref:FHA domain-containing protein n=1 Tax=Streptomyces sp. KMM 9044 TaxID=2744474 RepID=UPI0021514CCF|nr:FHA domain-containing protein [Streptomyces sp. KMM 9044]WAX81533.1 FHA domain-containing protein [Streptomyces sp. KMM 9044]
MSDIVMDDARVSWHHAVLHPEDGHRTLEDEHSANATYTDGHLLVAVPQDPPAPEAPLSRTADPRPLLTRAEEVLAGYRAAVEARAGGLDGEGFRVRTRGLRVGLVVDGESLWFYDSDHGRWIYTDGTRLHIYAVDEPPRATEAPEAVGHAPTRIVPGEPVRSVPAEPTRVVTSGPPGA